MGNPGINYVNNLGLTNVWSVTSANVVLKNFLVWITAFFVKNALNRYILNVLKYQLKSTQKCAEIINPFFIKPVN